MATSQDQIDDSALTTHGRQWAEKRSRQGVSRLEQARLLREQNERCALSGAMLEFDVDEGTPKKGDRGCHPLYPAVDHIDPGNRSGGYQLICYALNDLKGHMPTECFNALTKTDEWKALMRAWRTQADIGPHDREAFKRLIRPNATPKRKGVKTLPDNVDD